MSPFFGKRTDVVNRSVLKQRRVSSIKDSSTRWLGRQSRDRYVLEARKEGFRSRAAFKLCQIDDQYRLLKSGHRVVDLGAAPGGWSQVAVKRVGALGSGGGKVVSADLKNIEAIQGATIIKGDRGKMMILFEFNVP